ncbi:MAG: hypothetical protein F6K31_26230 [Symploca sp. SIO2G7]|nr:hypothetical protein [Symploca sp. SIO2G7]
MPDELLPVASFHQPIFNLVQDLSLTAQDCPANLSNNSSRLRVSKMRVSSSVGNSNMGAIATDKV